MTATPEGDWTIAVDPEDDTLNLKATLDDVDEEWKVHDASTYFPWAAALGKHVRWAWLMENQRGSLCVSSGEAGPELETSS